MTASDLRVLYVGQLDEGGTCLQRMEAMRRLGVAVTPIHTHPPAVRAAEARLGRRVRRKLVGPADLGRANAQVLERIADGAFDVVWIDKGVTIDPATLRAVREAQPRAVVAGYSPDDMMNPANQSRRFRAGLPLYDVYFTTKSYGVAELRALGCPRVEFIGNAFDPDTHRPLPVTDEDRRRLGGPVGFVGQREAPRERSLRFLAERGVGVRVWGHTWERCRRVPAGLKLENRPLWGDDYARAIAAFDINLCFLRKCNRDVQTTRSIEIPAAGGFMLAERTDEHRALFEEGREAEFFGGDDELLDKTRYYLAHDEARRRIAAAGRQRCLRSGYSNLDRMRSMLGVVESLRSGSPGAARALAAGRSPDER